MSAAELFVWGIEESIGLKLPVTYALAHLVDGIGMGELFAVPIGIVGIAAGGMMGLTRDLGSGVSDVIDAMSQENQERLRLEQEWMNQISAERKLLSRLTLISQV